MVLLPSLCAAEGLIVALVGSVVQSMSFVLAFGSVLIGNIQGLCYVIQTATSG